jgi:mannose-6-phosphate isomerase-like protein (cupin superfamily)
MDKCDQIDLLKGIIEMIKKRSVAILVSVIIAVIAISASDILLSGVYKYENMKVVNKSYGWTGEILKGQTRSLEMFEIKAIGLMKGKGLATYTVEAGVDELIIIMEGTGEFFIKNKPKVLSKGSVAVIPQGEKVRLRNGGRKDMIYYTFRFKTGKKSSKSITTFISQWDTITFKPSANGGRRNIINQETSAMKNLEIHVTTLKEGLPSHAAHTHADEEIILIRKGTAEESIGDFSYPAPLGSAIFLTNVDRHGIKNAGKGECEYYAIRWITTSDNPNK